MQKIQGSSQSGNSYYERYQNTETPPPNECLESQMAVETSDTEQLELFPLPREDINHILTFASARSRVGEINREWQALRAAQEGKILKKLNSDSVDISKLGFDSWNEVFQWIKAKGQEKLISLELDSQVTTSIDEIVNSNPNILKLSIRNYNDWPSCSQFKNLRYLRLEVKATEKMYRDLTGFETLTHLDLSRVWDGAIRQADPSILESLKELEFLILNDYAKLTDRGLKAFSTQLKKLKVFSIRNNFSITDEGLKHLNTLPLQYLKVSQCSQINGKGLSEQKNLLKLDLSQSNRSQLTDEVLEAIASGSPKLKYLDVSSYIQGNTLEGSSLKKFTQLRFLNIMGNGAITEDTLKEVFQACPNLQYFMCDGREITDEVVECLAQHCKELRYLSILNSKMTDKGVEHLKNLPKLRVLDLPGTRNITDAALKSISLFPSLKELGLRGCPNITFENPHMNYKNLLINITKLNLNIRHLPSFGFDLDSRLVNKGIIQEEQLGNLSLPEDFFANII